MSASEACCFFSSVLIYLSSLAVNTLISCLLSFLLPVYMKPSSRVIFVLLLTPSGCEQRSRQQPPDALRLRRFFLFPLCGFVGHVCPGSAGSRTGYTTQQQQPLSPRASPPSEPKGNRVTREDRADRNRERGERD